MLAHLKDTLFRCRTSTNRSPQRANRQQAGGEGREKHHGGAEVYCLEQYSPFRGEPLRFISMLLVDRPVPLQISRIWPRGFSV